MSAWQWVGVALAVILAGFAGAAILADDSDRGPWWQQWAAGLAYVVFVLLVLSAVIAALAAVFMLITGEWVPL